MKKCSTDEEIIFTGIFRSGYWGEPRSGMGSTLANTVNVRQAIIQLVTKYEIACFFDCPCGDMTWMGEIAAELPNYLGGDIVAELIEENQERFPGRRFLHFNLIEDPVPPEVDLLFCRDLLGHLPDAMVWQVLRNVRQSGCRYFLATTYLDQVHRNTYCGNWRPLSLMKPPYSFPQPLELIREEWPPETPGFKDKSLALWGVADIPSRP